MCFSFFFFQAEDGIRDGTVTGVQTCALPISDDPAGEAGAHGYVAAKLQPDGVEERFADCFDRIVRRVAPLERPVTRQARSEERRVGKEGRSWWWAEHSKRKW